jgi:DNA-binding LytR/AlgR family response regulator
MSTQPLTDRFVVTDSKGDRCIIIKRLLYIEAARNYCDIHYLTPDKEPTCVTICRPMAYYVGLLGDQLLQVHRSRVVNLRHISGTRGHDTVLLNYLADGVKASREGIKAVRQFLRNVTPGH